ncbi:MAG: glycosyltransferase 87 family protein, partial [Leifsonia sp.]
MATTTDSPALPRRAERRAAILVRLQTRRALITGFVALHAAFLIWLFPLMVAGGAEGDLPLYRKWAMSALETGLWPGIDTDWVYPAGALVPVVLPAVFGAAAYQFVWFLLVTAANAASLWVLTDGGRRRTAFRAAWWWLAMLLVLSPVALLRLESFTTPLVIAALVILATRPVLASALLTVATWIKIWPAAVLLAAVIASARRRSIAVVAAVTSLVIVVAAVAAGGLWHVTGFLSMQDGRGLQLEAPLSTPWVWMAIL